MPAASPVRANARTFSKPTFFSQSFGDHASIARVLFLTSFSSAPESSENTVEAVLCRYCEQPSLLTSIREGVEYLLSAISGAESFCARSASVSRCEVIFISQ
ncbi:MAG: hypothetical protein LBM04_12910 [Opitutaceae bacterium]|nr:hypothetical protein [Opitutaceae bacterium]